MNKVAVVYWSGTGNTELMAQKVAEGVREAGPEAVVLSVDLADVSELKKARAFALGCPSMGAEQLEETQMEPFMCDLENGIGGKQIGLFGSFGWGGGEWMRDWEERVRNVGASVVGEEGIIVNGAPDEEAEEKCKELGRTLAAAVS